MRTLAVLVLALLAGSDSAPLITVNVELVDESSRTVTIGSADGPERVGITLTRGSR